MANDKFIAPEGGWGWVIVLAFALNYVIVVPIFQNFGMIYGQQFKQLGISATETFIIINANQTFGMILGMMNGPLLRRYGYRKLAFVGSFVYASGIILTSCVRSFVLFFIFYGIMTSLGMSIGIAAFSLAINTYFKEKRGRAMGWSMTFAGLGPIFMPQLISLLLSIYGSQGTMLILGALSLHSIVGATLLHPIKWYAVKEGSGQEVSEKGEDDAECRVVSSSLLNDSTKKFSYKQNKKLAKRNSRTTTLSNTDYEDDNISVYGFETSLSIQNGSLLDLRETNVDKKDSNTAYLDFMRRSSLIDSNRSKSLTEVKLRKFSVGSIKYSEFALKSNALLEHPEEEKGEEEENSKDNDTEITEHVVHEFQIITENAAHTDIKLSLCARLLKRLNKLFDLDLLRDPIYVNIMLGMSIAIFAEFNFAVLTPFILTDMHLTTENVATMMSVLASSDLILRALAPYIGEWLKKPPRIMYLFSLSLLILTRTGLMFASSFTGIIFVAVGLGIAKGLRTVYMPLVIPSYVPLERLANASSIQSLVNGFIMTIIGPFLGVIRDKTGSYVFCIIFINFVTAVTIVMWLAEFAFRRIKK